MGSKHWSQDMNTEGRDHQTVLSLTGGTCFFLHSLFQLCTILLVAHTANGRLRIPSLSALGGQGKDVQSFLWSCASFRARNMKPCVGLFPSFPFTNEVEESTVNEAAQLWPGMQWKSSSLGLGMVAMTLQNIHHDCRLWIFSSWLMTSCLSFLVSKYGNNVKQLRAMSTDCFSTALEMLF